MGQDRKKKMATSKNVHKLAKLAAKNSAKLNAENTAKLNAENAAKLNTETIPDMTTDFTEETPELSEATIEQKATLKTLAEEAAQAIKQEIKTPLEEISNEEFQIPTEENLAQLNAELSTQTATGIISTAIATGSAVVANQGTAHQAIPTMNSTSSSSIGTINLARNTPEDIPSNDGNIPYKTALSIATILTILGVSYKTAEYFYPETTKHYTKQAKIAANNVSTFILNKFHDAHDYALELIGYTSDETGE